MGYLKMVLPSVKYWEVYFCASVSTLFPFALCLDHYLSTRNEWESTMIRSLIRKNLIIIVLTWMFHEDEVKMISDIFFFHLFRAAPAAYGGSQAKGQIGAVAAYPTLGHSHSNARSLPH